MGPFTVPSWYNKIRTAKDLHMMRKGGLREAESL